ncbi:TIGR04282 family arsenosugar biosynthesis glycosyltransferase [Halanaerobaculum tunisiense]
MSTGIILMTRAPIPGETNTRLETHLTGQQCAQLHQAFLQDISQMLLEIKEKREAINLYLTYTPSSTADMFTDLVPAEFNFFAQEGPDLGAKMYHALEHVASENEKQIILGSDLPTLQPNIILAALQKLDKQDVVVGPSQDGGYYLLGTKTPTSVLFTDIVFGNNDVLEATIKAIKEKGLKYELVTTWPDIDLFPELVELYNDLTADNQWESYPQATAKLVTDLVEAKLEEGGDLYVQQQVK